MKRRCIDAHCHLFNGSYALRDALTIGRDITRGEYRLSEWNGESAVIPLNASLATSWQARLESLVSLFTVIRERCADNYARECEAFRGSAMAPAQLHVFPMLMDIYYIFAPPCPDSANIVPALPSLASDDPTWFDTLRTRLAKRIETRVMKSVAKDTFASEAEKTTRDKVRVRIRTLAADFEAYLRERDKPESTTVAPINYAGMPVSWGYKSHIEDLLALQHAHPGKVFPFIGVDPRRPRVLDFLTTGATAAGAPILSHHGPFYGVKVYPPLGFHPYAAPLMEIFQFCEEKGFPVTAHCQPVSFFNAISGSECDEHGEFYAHPKHWIPVLQAFPKLRLNLAHFGGEESVLAYAQDPDSAAADWTRTIAQLLEYPHVYTDTAAITRFGAPAVLREIIRREPLVAKKMMFGTDYVICMFRDDLDGKIGNYFDLYQELPDAQLHENAHAFLAGHERE